MIINRAIVSTDNNPLYYEFWPLVAKAWRNMKIEPTVVVVGEVNLNYALGTVIKYPVDGELPTGFISQVIRFIIPCFYPEQVSVIGDMDMIPLNRDYFQKKIANINNDDIVIFSSDAYKNELRYPMCYIAAKGKYFQEIIGLKDLRLETINEFISYLLSLNKNWDTDELFFAEQLHRSYLLKNAVFLKRGGWNPFAKNRIDRVKWKYSILGLAFQRYIDAHSLRPLNEHVTALTKIKEYLEKGSVGKAFFMHQIKKPIKASYKYLSLFNQNVLKENLYTILEIKVATIKKKNVISFALYGNAPRYTYYLKDVIHSYHTFFPEWKCRVYVARDVSIDIVELLISLDSEVVIMSGKGVKAQFTNWRFLAIEDKNAEAVIIRDLDSFASARDKKMVDHWMNSDKKFHIIRDHVNHNQRILAGMWGAKSNKIDIRKESKKFVMIDAYGIDQLFLEHMIYPLIKNDVLIHDSFPRFPDENPIVIPLLPGDNYIGSVDTEILTKEQDQRYLTIFKANNFTIS